MKSIFIGLVLAAVAGWAQAAPARVTIAQGALEGTVDNGVAVFKDIPYAASPVGPLRWRPPAPPPRWRGVREATTFGPACMQSKPSWAEALSVSEDCLTLNIWAPAGARRAPVMVWIHGGAFVWGTGASAFYDGSNFVRRGIVLVTINYRLGRFGFFAHPALTAEARGGPTADYGLMDQIAALKWVKANIAAFGGDPARVTIAGESAGAMSVNFLMAAPAARGLFVGAISESGFGRSPGSTLAEAERVGESFADSVGVKGDGPTAAAALRALPAEALVKPPKGLLDPARPWPVVDGRLIPQQPFEAFARHAEAKVPYLVGGNSWEAALLPQLTADPAAAMKRLGPDEAAAASLYDAADHPRRAAADILTDAAVIEPDRYLAERVAADGHEAFVYYFAYLPAALRARLIGVPHGGEIGYVFGNLPDKPGVFAGDPFPAATPEDRKLSAAVTDYWAAFVKNGNPDSAGGPRWPSLTPATQTVMVFGDAGPEPTPHFEQPKLDLMTARAVRAGGTVAAAPRS
ncbi:MAG TPA: carboxylesterase family protein [Caulobacteraceae bacterium]|nr:carboxylesterase family protein [Caulobacteraceae bacterium]